VYEPHLPNLVSRVDVAGIKNLPFKVAFTVVFYAFTAVVVKGLVGMPYPGLWPIVGLLTFFALVSCVLARSISRYEVARANRRLMAQYESELAAARGNAPLDHLRLDEETGHYIDVRRPLLPPPPPVLDPNLGKLRKP